MTSHVLRVEIQSTSEIKEISSDELIQLIAQSGVSYSLLKRADNTLEENVVLRKQGDKLLVEVDGQVIAEIENFYQYSDASFQLADGHVITAETLSDADSDIVWQPATAVEGGSSGFAAT